MSAPARDGGYATLAAMLASACFVLLASQIARTSGSGVVGVNAERVHARLAAAADAGLAIALDRVLADDPGMRWDIVGGAHRLSFDQAELQIEVQDERGKIPLNRITEGQAAAMFRLAGADLPATERLTQAMMARRDPDRKPAAATPAAGDERTGFETVQELNLLPGMTASLYAALQPIVTVDAGDAAFDPRTASPVALQVMQGEGRSAVAAIQRQREASGQRTAFQTAPSVDLAGRTLTVRVAAIDAGGGRFSDSTTVQITGVPSRPFIVRQHHD